MHATTIQESVRMWQNEPGRAHVRPLVAARSDGAQVVLESGPFAWRSDLPPTLGGTYTAPSPIALLLGALAGCAVALIRDTLAPQLGVQVDAVTAEARCAADFRGLLGMDDALPQLQELQLTVTIHSSEPEDRVQELFRVWQQRCPVYLALIQGLPVNASLVVTPQG